MSRYLIHPFLIGSFPVLYLYSRNFEQVGFSDVLAPLMTSVLLSLLILLVTRRVLRDARKAGLITSAFLVWFFSYGHLYEIVETLPFARHRYILAVTGLGLLTVIYYVLKSKIELGRATTALNYISILLTFNCVVYYGLQHGNLNEIEAKIEVISGGNANVTDTRPDIYYIILDAYAGGGDSK